jgi:hypothetical protein
MQLTPLHSRRMVPRGLLEQHSPEQHVEPARAPAFETDGPHVLHYCMLEFAHTQATPYS